MKTEKQIPVGTVCAMFGLNPNTIRTWERRYGFPSPVRSAGGHRTYSESDIAHISLIVTLMKAGASPGDAIKQAEERMPAAKIVDVQRSPHTLEAEILSAIKAHDHARLTLIARQALDQLGYRPFIELLAFPLLARLGHNWEVTGQGVADEHAFTLTVSAIVLEQFHSIKSTVAAPVVTFACAPGEVHQLALLHLCNLVLEQGVAQPLVLAAGLPIQDIIDASNRGQADLILLTATTSPSAADTRQWVSAIMNAGWANKLILAGPGFMRTRIFSDNPVRAAAGGFSQTVNLVASMLKAHAANDEDKKKSPGIHRRPGD